MLQDLRLGRLTEVRELNGAIAGLARRLGVPVATHEAILATMVELEAGRERPGRQALARAAARAAAGARRVH
jgi:ketopantoate reductase